VERVAEDAADCRARLGAELRLLRKAARLTQVEAARRLGFSQPKVNKIETSTNTISAVDLELLLGVYRADPEIRLRLRQLATKASGGRLRAAYAPTVAFRRYLDAEREAVEIQAWNGERIPGPLQSEAYMLKQHESVDGLVVAALLSRRRERANLFRQEKPPRYRVILSESALHRMPGGQSPATIFDIASHLLALSETYPRLELQILPFRAPVSFVDSDFVTLRFAPGSGRTDFAYIEYPGGGIEKRDAKSVRACRADWVKYHDAALGVDDTKKFLKKVVEENRRLLA
jgi:transcriptional regulator with XRE-family HTH domain